MDTRYVQRVMLGEYILHKLFFSTSCIWRHYFKVAYLTFWHALAVCLGWFSFAHSSGFRQLLSFNLYFWLLDSTVFGARCCVCGAVEVASSACTACVCEEYMVRGWEGEHPWGLKPSASLQQLSVCPSAPKGTEPQAFMRVKRRPHFHSLVLRQQYFCFINK